MGPGKLKATRGRGKTGPLSSLGQMAPIENPELILEQRSRGTYRWDNGTLGTRIGNYLTSLFVRDWFGMSILSVPPVRGAGGTLRRTDVRTMGRPIMNESQDFRAHHGRTPCS